MNVLENESHRSAVEELHSCNEVIKAQKKTIKQERPSLCDTHLPDKISCKSVRVLLSVFRTFSNDDRPKKATCTALGLRGARMATFVMTLSVNQGSEHAIVRKCCFLQRI